MLFQRKHIRLAPENYVGKRWFFVTLCCAARQKFFARGNVCNWFLHIARRDAAAHPFAVHAYCIMPDHLHLLVEGLQPDCDLQRFMKALKTKTSSEFEHNVGRPLWQKKFYDHILRQNDSPDSVAWYIWMNPVRAGLCLQPQDYRWLGSFTGLAPAGITYCDTWLPPWRKLNLPATARGRYISTDKAPPQLLTSSSSH